MTRLLCTHPHQLNMYIAHKTRCGVFSYWHQKRAGRSMQNIYLSWNSCEVLYVQNTLLYYHSTESIHHKQSNRNTSLKYLQKVSKVLIIIHISKSLLMVYFLISILICLNAVGKLGKIYNNAAHFTIAAHLLWNVKPCQIHKVRVQYFLVEQNIESGIERK